jgi:lipopolysaccharide transport protein LptA
MSRYPMAAIAGRAALCLLVFCSAVPPVFAGPLDFSTNDTVTVSAERAWEADEADVIHFSGRFELHAPDWSLFGESAVVYGKLDNPDRVIVEGKPARIAFLRDVEGKDGNPDSVERIDGAASFVEYFRATDKLLMRGSASLTREESTLVSELIEYDVDADRYSASGEGGIDIQFNPEDD